MAVSGVEGEVVRRGSRGMSWMAVGASVFYAKGGGEGFLTGIGSSELDGGTGVIGAAVGFNVIVEDMVGRVEMCSCLFV